MIVETKTFNCPHCSALSFMTWFELAGKTQHGGYKAFGPDHPFWVVGGPCCNKLSIWKFAGIEGDDVIVSLVYPLTALAPLPHPDMPGDIAIDFEEARQISSQSPRAAAALLRLCVQKICNLLLGKPGKIDDQIGQLVAGGLPKKVQQALDAVRVIGNESVHPGTLDLNDSPEVAQALFRLVNLIVQDCISAPKEAEDVYGLLPAGKREGIERRDAKAKG